MKINVFDLEKDEFIFTFYADNIAVREGQQIYFNDKFYSITNVTYVVKDNNFNANIIDLMEVEVLEVLECH